MSRPDISSAAALVHAIGDAIGQRPVEERGGWSFALADPAADDLDADLWFALTDASSLALRVWFEGRRARLEPGRGAPCDTICGSIGALLDFFSNQRSSQALLLDRDWRLGDGGGLGAHDLDDLRDYVRALETLLPAPYELTDGMRQRVHANASRASSQDLRAIERRVGLAPADFLATFVRTGTPVVFQLAQPRGAWWSFDQLQTQFGDVHTHLSRYPNCSYGIRSCLDQIVAGDPTAFKAALPVTAALRQHYAIDDYFPAETVFAKAQALLVAPADDRMPSTYRATAWHRDWADNLLTQVIGCKRVSLVSPADHEAFALRTTPACHYNVAVDHSPVDAKASDALAGIMVHQVTLEPGDVLFIPCGWLHTVVNLAASAAINCWRIRPPELLDADS